VARLAQALEIAVGVGAAIDQSNDVIEFYRTT